LAKNSIAVLPLANASQDPNMEYLSDGITESLINSLSQLPDVRVLARSTMFRFKGQDVDPQAVGKQLGVDTVLTGRVVQVGDSLSVQADLVNVADGTQLWGERYSRKASDILATQEDIAREIAGKLRHRLSGEEQGRLTKRYTENIEAYQAYLRGRYEWNKRTAEGLNKAVGYFNQAIQIDPAYALAYAGIADSYALLPQFGNTPFEESLAKAKAAAQRAIEIDNSLAEAHISLANVKASLWDWNGVEDGYRRGLRLNPNYATGHQWYSEYLASVGRLGEAEKEIRLAQQLDPLSLIINTRVGITLYFARRYDEAVAQLQKALQFDPDFLLPHIFLFQSLSQQGMYREAIPHYIKGFFKGRPPEERAKIESALQAAYAAAGEQGMTEKLLDILRQQKEQDYAYPTLMADTLTQLGDKDEAFVWLNRAADVKHPALGGIKVDPRFDPLRSDPRFADLMRRVGLTQ
jgi:TolB-like protein/Tfp pilus assembly protein PilF